MRSITLEKIGLGNADLAAIGKLSESGLTPQEIADNVKYGVRSFKNEDNINLKIFVSDGTKNWTKSLTSKSGIIAIGISNIYNTADLNTLLNIQILEDDISKKARDIRIVASWDRDTNTWLSGYADDILGLEKLNIAFAKNSTLSKAYILLGSINTVWSNSRVKVSIPISSYNSDIDFNISVISSLENFTIDLEREASIAINIDTLGTLEDFTNNLD